MRKSTVTIFLVLFGVMLSVWALQPATTKKKARPQSNEMIRLIHADRLYFNERINREAQFLVGNVVFEHQGARLYCDSALYYQESKSFDAFGHVKMLQGDTLSLTGDVLYYNGADQMARVRYNVVLKHRQSVLTTDSLDYDRLYDLGYFFEGGKLIDKDNQLTSYWGQYSPSTRDAFFSNNVKLLNPLPPAETKSRLQSDTLYYNTRTGIAHVVGPSDIDHGKTTHIYTTNGYYNSQDKQSYLLDRSILQDVDKVLTGDSLHYDGITKDAKAYGRVEYEDRANLNRFYGNYGLYNDSTGYAEAADSALCVDYSQKDTMFAHADTFKVFAYNLDTDSAFRVVHAYNHVRAYRVDIQAVCDSMVFNSKDSCATMYKDPIVWQQGDQVLGELIKAWVNDSTIDSVHVVSQALMVERLDSMHYNQISGDEIHSYFRDGKVYLNEVVRNVFLNYYPYDSDSLLIGMVHAESSELRMFMDDQKLQKIWMPETKGTMYPVDQTPPKERFLENFAWFDYVRPLDKDDVFNWRGKKPGTELKPTVHHEVPKQSLQDVKGRKKDVPRTMKPGAKP